MRSTSPSSARACLAASRTKSWNFGLRATKSVSLFTSTIAARWPAVTTPMRPSAAVRPAFLAAFDRPFLRSQSTAASRSPCVSASAALQSIMPAPVNSRSSFTMLALMFVIVALPFGGSSVSRGGAGGRGFLGRNGFQHVLGFADVHARRHLALREAVDHGTRREVAIKRDGARRVVIARDGKRDPVGIRIRVENGRHGNAKLSSFRHRDRFLVGVDHEEDAGQPPHILDAAERTLELVAFAQDLQQLLLGQTRSLR